MFLEGDLNAGDLIRLETFLVDPLLQVASWGDPCEFGVEIALLPGVTDAASISLMRAASQLHVDVSGTAIARRLEFGPGVSAGHATSVVERVVANPVIERWAVGTIDPTFHLDASASGVAAQVEIAGRTAAELVEIGNQRSLALDVEELLAIQGHFAKLNREPTDVEMETLAQTWSEHCAHKTFRAELTTDDGRTRRPLMAALRHCTETIAAPFVKSSFVGNAGIVGFHGDVTIALKAETHNHPSAVEPFGGANTGVGGVIRDVLGIAHRPIAITDVLCFGQPDLPPNDVPQGALHPLRIREGVIDGVADYGNKIGLPTVAGAVLYDAGYTTNPLVFAGCIGVAQGWKPHTGPFPGDRVVVLGGRTGRDGIKGATFSSLTMDATTGEVAGASVQIGDPIVEKLLIDVLIGAEHLYTAITDCGAGGLSSAVGEMAEHIGADIELSLVPLKYHGLEPWEIWLSEAQERMVVAVSPDHIDALRSRCATFGVEMADLGDFTGAGVLVVRSQGAVVLELPTEFLHNGRPQRKMRATMPRPDRANPTHRVVDDPRAMLLRLLSHRNIASKSTTIRRFDHEILGSTVVRPLIGQMSDAPADGVVLAPPNEQAGIAIGIGVNPWHALFDPEAMAFSAVDEAIRNIVAVGADPDKIALLDNFSWGDPRRESTLGDLVAAVDGCCAAATAHGAPFVSGKDSLNNEYTGSDGQRHSVPPTLVITAVGHVPDVDKCVTPDLKSAGNVVVLLGSTMAEFAGSHLDLVQGTPDEPGVVPTADHSAPNRYRILHRFVLDGIIESCHDVSEGGLAVALAEMCIGGRLGIEIDALPNENLVTSMFSESASRHIVEINPHNLSRLLESLPGAAMVLGFVTDEQVLTFPNTDPIPVGELVDAFNRVAMGDN